MQVGRTRRFALASAPLSRLCALAELKECKLCRREDEQKESQSPLASLAILSQASGFTAESRRPLGLRNRPNCVQVCEHKTSALTSEQRGGLIRARLKRARSGPQLWRSGATLGDSPTSGRPFVCLFRWRSDILGASWRKVNTRRGCHKAPNLSNWELATTSEDTIGERAGLRKSI